MDDFQAAMQAAATLHTGQYNVDVRLLKSKADGIYEALQVMRSEVNAKTMASNLSRENDLYQGPYSPGTK